MNEGGHPTNHSGKTSRASNPDDISRTTEARSWAIIWRWPNLPLLSPSKRGALLSKQSQRRERSEARSRVHRHHTVHKGMCGIKSSKPRQSCPKEKQLSDNTKGSENNAPPGLNTKRNAGHTRGVWGVGRIEEKNSLLHQVHLASKLIPSAINPLPPFPFSRLPLPINSPPASSPDHVTKEK